MTIFLILVNLSLTIAQGQIPSEKSSHKSRTKVKSYLTGNQLPNLPFEHIWNYTSKKSSISAFKGKWLLLDFWSTHCAGCIVRFPVAMALQDKYRDRLQILSVNASEPLSLIAQFFEKRERLDHLGFSLPVVYGDPRFNQWFDHDGVPFYVLVDPDGKVYAMPDEQEVNDANIQALLENKPVAFTKKAFKLIPTDGAKPLFIKGNGGNGDELLWYSLLSKKVEGMPTSSSMACNERFGYRYCGLNLSALEFYQTAYYDGFKTNEDFDNEIGTQSAWILDNRTILRVKDTAKYATKLNGIYQQWNRYTYQIIAPKVTYLELKAAMQADLKKYFGLKVSFEKKRMKCLVMSCSDTSLVSSKGGEVQSDFSDLGVNFKNYSFKELFFYIAYATQLYYSPYPLIDQTGIKGKVDIRFEADMNSFQSIADAVSKLGLKFELKEWDVDMLVLTEPDYDPNNSNALAK